MSLAAELFDKNIISGFKKLIKIYTGNKRKYLWGLVGDINYQRFDGIKEIDITNSEIVEDFIGNNEDLKTDIEESGKIINSYVENKNSKKRPLNILISAPPGSGKSFLLEQWEKKFNLIFLEYNLSTLISKEEVFTIFKAIRKENKKKRVPIVFIDEIDTIINGEYIFPLLLSVMSSGKSKFINKEIYCNNAILVFSGSGLFDTNEEKGISLIDLAKRNFMGKIIIYIIRIANKIRNLKNYFKWKEFKIKTLKNKTNSINKFPDFLDRIDLFLMLPPIFIDFENYNMDKELQEIAVALIKKHFKNVTTVELHYLIVIMTMLLTFDSRRDAESIIFLTVNTKGVHLKFNDLPSAIRKKFETKLKDIEIKNNNVNVIISKND